jgi:hypothetical protein
MLEIKKKVCSDKKVVGLAPDLLCDNLRRQHGAEPQQQRGRDDAGPPVQAKGVVKVAQTA